MTISTGSYIKDLYDATTNLGAKVISSDFTIQIAGFEDTYLLAKQCPWPDLTPTGEIEIPMPLGATGWEPQQLKFAQQGQIAFYETVAGNIDQMLVDLILRKGNYAGLYATFDAWIYEGTPSKYLRRKRIVNCFIQMDPVDRDWENRQQPLMFQGTMFYHYFGEMEEGNSTDYR